MKACNVRDPDGVVRCELARGHDCDHAAPDPQFPIRSVRWPVQPRTRRARVVAGIEPVSAGDIMRALVTYHTSGSTNFGRPSVAVFPELRIGTGFQKIEAKMARWARESVAAGLDPPVSLRDAADRHDPADNPEARIDLFVMSLRPSKSFRRIAYEIKCSRADFTSEIKSPHKRQPAMAVSNLFVFATPKGMVNADEVPEDCGLVWVTVGKRPYTVKSAPWRDVGDPPVSFLASIARRSCK